MLSVAATASGAVVLEDFDPTDGGFWGIDGGVTASVANHDGDPDNEIRVTDTNGGFQAALRHAVPRSGGLMANLYNDGATWQWEAQGLDADNTGTFLNLHVVLNTDVADALDWDGDGNTTEVIGFRAINGSGRGFAVDTDFSGTYSWDMTTSARYANVVDALEQWQDGAGSYLQFFVIQQTNGVEAAFPSGAQSIVTYDDFALTGNPIPEPTSLGLLALGAGILLRRRQA